MGWKLAGIDGKGCANTTYISEFHPHIPKPWFRIICFCIFVYFMCFETQNRVSRVLPWKCLTGVGYIDADWKVSTLEININFSLWTKSSKYEFQHLLTTKSSIPGFVVFIGFDHHVTGIQSLTPPTSPSWSLSPEWIQIRPLIRMMGTIILIIITVTIIILIITDIGVIARSVTNTTWA